MERSSLTLFINNGWYLPAVSGGDVHVMEVAARWARVRDVAVAMPGWAYHHQRARLEVAHQDHRVPDRLAVDDGGRGSDHHAHSG